MTKDNLLNYFILILLYIGVSALPFNLIPNVSNVLFLILQCGAQIIYFVFAYFFIKRQTTFKLKEKRKKVNPALFLPCLLACASNFLYFIFAKGEFSFTATYLLPLKILLNLFIVINEEFLFRVLFINNNELKSNISKIVISAGIFALCHLTKFITTLNLGDLINVVYTFFLGLMLGMVYVYINKVTYVIILHFLFNVVNGVIFASFKFDKFSPTLYMLANTIIVVVLSIYLCILYINLFRKENK